MKMAKKYLERFFYTLSERHFSKKFKEALYTVFAQCWRARQRNVSLENVYVFSFRGH